MRRLFLYALSLLLAAACSAHKTPLIGISCSRGAGGATQLATTYTEAVQRAGGTCAALINLPALPRFLPHFSHWL